MSPKKIERKQNPIMEGFSDQRSLTGPGVIFEIFSIIYFLFLMLNIWGAWVLFVHSDLPKIRVRGSGHGRNGTSLALR